MSQEAPLASPVPVEETSASHPAPLTASHVVRATCWGTRGSIPSPGPATARFGGNTPCLEVRLGDGRALVFDAGTGIRAVGRRLEEVGEPVRLDLFLTHFHWDHIQGMPFFGPLYDEESFIRVHGARQGETDIQSLFAGQMTPVYFPVPFDAIAAQIDFRHLDDEPWEDSGVEVAAFRARHPAWTYGYRIRSGGVSIAYMPDNELVGGPWSTSDRWRSELVRFLDGVDVLYHDAMFTDEEYTRREGWGHSTFRQAMRLAEEAGVRRLQFFHHSPERSDAELLEILDGLGDDLLRHGSDLRIGAAEEGAELVIQEKNA